MSAHGVGIGECRVSDDPSDVLVAHALGSCIAVAVYDPAVRVAGLLHYMLPESSLDTAKAQANPFLFADTGIPELFYLAYDKGAVKHRLIVMAAGGANVLDPMGAFHIGRRNQQAMQTIFLRAGIVVRGEEIGGVASRTMRIEVATGRVWLRTAGRGEQEMTAGCLRHA
jgi:chemotaxis protein CheD